MIDHLARARWNHANKRARQEYAANPAEFNKLKYCAECSRLPIWANNCRTCDARLRMRELRAVTG